VNRNTRMSLVLGIAVVVAGLASFGVYLAVVRRPAVRVEVPSAMVVVAARPLDLGASLSNGDVRLVAWPARNPVGESFAKIDDVVNRGLIAPIGENEPITESKLAPLGAGAGLPPAIRPGMRAMSVKVNEVIGVAGFVVPGTKVDVLVTIRQDRVNSTLTVVSNITVLTAGSRYDQAEAKKEGKAINSSVVTLMVTPSDAERIALAQTEGQLMLALRNPLDMDTSRPELIRTAELMGTPPSPPQPKVVFVPRQAERPAAAAPPPPPQEVPKPVRRLVQVVSAGKSEVVTIQ